MFPEPVGKLMGLAMKRTSPPAGGADRHFNLTESLKQGRVEFAAQES
jgi:hypothetical protein